MSEGLPQHESKPHPFEVRRDALLLRIVELREKVSHTDFDPEIVSAELTELDRRVQQVKGELDMEIFEQLFDSIEKMVDSRIQP